MEKYTLPPPPPLHFSPSLYTDVVLFFFSFFSKTSASSLVLAVDKSGPAVYILSPAFD